jgi:predicted outer membrane repeat protein
MSFFFKVIVYILYYISRNYAKKNGGAVTVDHSSIIINTPLTLFAFNEANESGGAIFMDNNSTY